MFGTSPLTSAVRAVCSELDGLTILSSGVLDGVRTSGLLTAAADLEHAQTRVSLAQARVLAALDVVAPATCTAGPDDPAPSVPGVGQTTAHEVAATLGCSVAAVRDRLAVARMAADVPAVLAAARVGALRWWQVRRVVEAVAGVGADARTQVDRRLAADAAAGRCRNRFGARLARAVLAADPAAADRVHREGVLDRRVTVRLSDAGMAWFGACLPAQDALTVARCLDELAAEPDGAALGAAPGATTNPTGPTGPTGAAPGPAPDSGAGRTADQRRADALTGMARAALEALHDCSGGPDGVTDDGLRERFTAHLAGHLGLRRDLSGASGPTSPPAGPPVSDPFMPGSTTSGQTTSGPSAARPRAAGQTAAGAARTRPRRAARRRAEIQLVVSAETVLGIADTPGELAGYGPVGPEQARQIAHLAGTTWRRLITDPVTGTVLDRGRSTYTPPGALADHVQARFGWTCTRPGCSNVAADLDHATAWAELGDTSVDNLHPVCRGCHTAKHAGWSVRIAPDGTTTWRTPHGRSSNTRPTDHRPEDRLPRTGAPTAVPPPDEPTGRPGDGRPSAWWEGVRRVVSARSAHTVPSRPVPTPAPF